MSGISPESDESDKITKSPLFQILQEQRCQECGDYIQTSERYICPTCGKRLCRICRKNHECEAVCELPTQKPASASSPAYTPTQTYTTPTFECPVKHSKPVQPQPAALADTHLFEDQPEVHHPEPSQSFSKSATAPQENYQYCDGCKRAFPVSSLRKCNKCGKIYCSRCQEKHESEHKGLIQKTLSLLHLKKDKN